MIKINEPGGLIVVTGDKFLDAHPSVVARTTPTVSAPYFVSEDLEWQVLGLRHQVYVVTSDSVPEPVVFSGRSGNVYEVCKLLNDNYYENTVIPRQMAENATALRAEHLASRKCEYGLFESCGKPAVRKCACCALWMCRSHMPHGKEA